MKYELCLLLLLFCGCSSRTKPKSMPPLSIKVAEVTEKTVPSTMEFSCRTHSLYEVELQPRISGYLQSVNYAQGMPVKRGQLLLTIEPSEYIANVATAESALASAKAQKVNATNTYNRYVPLSEKRAISRSALDGAVAELAEARAAVNSAKASLENAKTDLNYTRLYAPFDGIIGTTNGSVGEYVGLGTDYQTINTVSNIDSIYVYLSIPTEKYIAIAMRDTLRKMLYNDERMLSNIVMHLNSKDQYPHRGIYKFTERAVNDQTGSVVLHVLFPNPEKVLRSGQYVTITADVGMPHKVLLIPQRCVMQNQGIDGVFTVDSDNKVKFRKVTLGNTYGTNWEIIEGLKSGERVLTEGLQKVHNNEIIKPKM